MRPGDCARLTWFERLVWKTRGWQVKGKGRLLMACAPRRGERVIPLVGDLRIRLDLADHLQWLMYLGLLHHDLIPALPRLLRPGGVFLDVGANIGFFTLYGAHHAGVDGRVLAIEAIPRTIARLRDNLQLNGLDRVETYCLALCDRQGPFRLHVPPAELKKDYLVTHHAADWEAVEIPGQTLPAFLDDHGVGHVDLMKIDIEGGEPLVFAGAETALRSGRVRAIMAEFAGPQLARHGLTCRLAVERLLALGFDLLAVGRHGALSIQATVPVFDDSRDYNLLFRHRTAPALPR